MEVEPDATVDLAAADDDSWRMPHARVDAPCRKTLDLAWPMRSRVKKDMVL